MSELTVFIEDGAKSDVVQILFSDKTGVILVHFTDPASTIFFASSNKIIAHSIPVCCVRLIETNVALVF